VAFAHLRGVGGEGDPPADLRGVGGERDPPADLPAGPAEHRLARIVEILAAEGGDVVAVDLTPPELTGTGVRVMRVVAPALIPILAHSAVRYLGSRRLNEAPRRMGYRVLSEEEVNPWPCPLL
jgi:ribosomal protein S12 methylthiotransferase accessory factor